MSFETFKEFFYEKFASFLLDFFKHQKAFGSKLLNKRLLVFISIIKNHLVGAANFHFFLSFFQNIVYNNVTSIFVQSWE